MYSDTHFHFQHFTESGVDGAAALAKMAGRDCFFALDIGTRADDLLERQAFAEKAISTISDGRTADKIRDFLYFSAGIWPSIDEIHNRDSRMNVLRAQVQKASDDAEQDTLHRKIIAVGECGLDHHWNPSGADGRNEQDFDEKTFRGERELFQMQLEFARELNLPVIIHSRDAFEDTLDCIRNVGYDNGIIHCYSYGLEEARAFVERGWYISFSGGITYTKKSKMEAARQLVRFVPDDRILCETDAPYLAPVPLRGQTNSPVFVEHTYSFVAAIRGVTTESLCATVDQNIRTLFPLEEK